MATPAFKVRLGDGSEIGPLDADMVRTWFQQGLIGPDSPVLRPGTTRWTQLGQAVNLQEWGGPLIPARPKSSGRSTTQPATQSVSKVHHSRPFDLDHWRVVVAGILFLLGAAVPGFWALKPGLTLPQFDATPWKMLFLGALALGLLLIRGWEFGRRLARGTVFVLSFTPFIAAGIFLAKGVRGSALLVLFCAWVVLSGFFALLAPRLSRGQTALSLATVLLGFFGVVRFGYVPESGQQKAVREWASVESRFEDDSLGVSLDLPGSWRILKPGNPLVQAPEDAKITFAHGRLGGFGYLLVESAPHGIVSLDHYLDRAGTRHTAVLGSVKAASLREVRRAAAPVGNLQGLQAEWTWEADGVRYRDLTTVWKDGWTYFTLTSWAPEANVSSGRGLESLVDRFATTGLLASKLSQAVRRASRDVPHLTPAAAEMLMEQSAAQILEPAEAFRRSYDLATRGIPFLNKPEAKEMADLTTRMYGSVPASYRTRLAAYFDRVRAHEMTTPQLDEEMNQLMRSAVLSLPEIKRARLQSLYEKAIGAAIKDKG